MPRMQRTSENPETWRAEQTAKRDALAATRRQEAAAHAAVEAGLRRRSRFLGVLRLVVFAAAVALVVRAARAESPGTAAAALGVLAFAALVAVHARVLAAVDRVRRARLLAQESAARLAGGTGPGTGAALRANPVSDLDAGLAVHRPEDRVQVLSSWALEDLGVEGESPSLHALLDTTQSELAGRRLRWLLRHALLDPEAIRARQAAVAELASDRALRDALLHAFCLCRGVPQLRLPPFLAAPRALPGGVLRFAVLLVGIVDVPLLVLAFRDPNFVPGAAACLAVALGFNFALWRRGALLRDAYLELEPVVRVAVEVGPRLAAHEPRSAFLGQLRDLFRDSRAAGSQRHLRSVARAQRMLHLHEIGFPWAIVQLLTLWDLHWLFTIEAEVKREAGRYERLVGALADLEAHVALGIFADEAPGTTMPEILDVGAPCIEIEAGEHPLIEFGRSVPNDVRLGGATRLAIVTGSNMAGKSTFLRMVALDVVLAELGVPVRARGMRLVPVALHANINVRDSLADGKSYFLVEVERVHGILAAASASPQVLGIFDELFRGTNSRERLAASREIARHLAASGGLFLLATHDQELAALATEATVPGVFALHFRDEIVDGRMVFPYRLEPGVATTHNAIRLLEITGYPKDIVERARQTAEGTGT